MKAYEEIKFPSGYIRWIREGDEYVCRMSETYMAEMKIQHEQPEPEPVAWADKYDVEREGHDFWVSRQKPARDGVPLYTAPKREWVGLTDEERIACEIKAKSNFFGLCENIEAKLKEKNSG